MLWSYVCGDLPVAESNGSGTNQIIRIFWLKLDFQALEVAGYKEIDRRGISIDAG
jgi:hypothetical protein